MTREFASRIAKRTPPRRTSPQKGFVSSTTTTMRWSRRCAAPTPRGRGSSPDETTYSVTGRRQFPMRELFPRAVATRNGPSNAPRIDLVFRYRVVALSRSPLFLLPLWSLRDSFSITTTRLTSRWESDWSMGRDILSIRSSLVRALKRRALRRGPPTPRGSGRSLRRRARSRCDLPAVCGRDWSQSRPNLKASRDFDWLNSATIAGPSATRFRG